jgi:parallel beta-helix repeat protein
LKIVKKGEFRSTLGVSGVLLVFLLVSTVLISVPFVNYLSHPAQTSDAVHADSTTYMPSLLNEYRLDSKNSATRSKSLLSHEKCDVRDRPVSSFLYVLSDISPFGTPHAPIYIDDDTDFETQGWPGDGSIGTPYIIAGLEINATTGAPAINITGTSVHFIIQDCWLTSNDTSIIELNSVSHAQIKNNSLIDCERGVIALHSTDLTIYENLFYSFSLTGVYLEDCSQSTLTKNNCTLNFIGLHIEQSDNILVEDNYLYDNSAAGIELYQRCEFIIVDNNTILESVVAIHLQLDCSNNIIEFNNCTSADAGIFCENCHHNSILNNFGRQAYIDIYLINCTSFTIDGNDCGYGLSFGEGSIFLHNSNNSVITNNRVENTFICIEVIEGSSHNDISSNNCTLFAGGVIAGYSGPSNVISNNNCSGLYTASEVGIYILESENCEVFANQCNQSQYNIVVESSNHTDIFGNTCYNASDLSLAIWDSHFINIDSNLLILGSTGIDVKDSTFITVNDNTCFNFTSGSTTGIYLNAVYNSTVEGNDLRYNTAGIGAVEFEGVITHNTIEENILYGLFVSGSTELNVTWNIFEDNGLNTEDNGLHTYIDYNYWSNYTGYDSNADGIGDIWHPIDGTANNNDTHPLMYYPTIPSWTIEPTDQDSEYGENFQYSLDIVIPPKAAPISEWWINNSQFVIDAGFISNETSLDLGEYQLEVRTYNLYGFYLSGTFTITVADTIAPVITGPEDFSFPSDSTGYHIVWSAYDKGPTGYSVTLDGILLQSGAWNSTNEEVWIFCDNLEVGQHTYTITYTDIGGNSAADTVIVTVTLSPAQIFGPIVAVVVGGLAIVVIVVALYLVRKRTQSK